MIPIAVYRWPTPNMTQGLVPAKMSGVADVRVVRIWRCHGNLFYRVSTISIKRTQKESYYQDFIQNKYLQIWVDFILLHWSTFRVFFFVEVQHSCINTQLANERKSFKHRPQKSYKHGSKVCSNRKDRIARNRTS